MSPGHWQESGLRCYAKSMEFRHILLIAALFFSADAFAQAYRWVDENGVIHYSDRPQQGAEEFQLPESDAPPRADRPAATPRTRSSDEPAPATEGYASIGFVSPEPEETLWNIGGVLNVQVALTPRLQPGHKLRVYLDGEPRDLVSMVFVLNEVWRGEHTLQAEVVDQNDELLIRSDPVVFFVQQTSVLTAPGAVGPVTAP